MHHTKLLFALLSLCALSTAADKWKNHSTDNTEGLSGNEIQFIEADSDGRLWIGTMQGIGYYQAGKFTTLVDKEKKDQPIRVNAWDILPLSEERYWIGHGGGAILYNQGKVLDTLNGNTVAPLIQFQKDIIWTIGKNRGTEENLLYESSGTDWAPVERFKKERVADLFRASNGHVWILIDGNGVYEVDPKEGVSKAVHHIEGTNVQSMTEDSKGGIWCGLWGRGVMVYDGKGWTSHIKNEKSAVLSMTSDAAGGIWVATSANGLWHYDGKSWQHDLAEEGSITLLTATSDGRVWVSSQFSGGLRYWNGKKWKESLPGPLPIRCLFEAPDKSLWAGGVLDGLHVLKK